MKIDNAKRDERKAARPGGILEGVVSFTDDEGAFHEMEFIVRRPATADMESYTRASQRNPLVANLTGCSP